MSCFSSSVLTVTGLSLDVLGVIVLFVFSPEKFADPQASAFFALEGEDKKKREEWVKKQPRRRRLAIAGAVTIAVGFLLQLVAEAGRAGWLWT